MMHVQLNHNRTFTCVTPVCLQEYRCWQHLPENTADCLPFVLCHFLLQGENQGPQGGILPVVVKVLLETTKQDHQQSTPSTSSVIE